MMINMAVAIITVKLKNVAGLDDFVELDEPLYALVYFWLMISGAGWISIDNLIRKTLEAALRNDKSPGLSSATSSAAVSPLR
jgi:putative oxidoreductase